MTTRSRYQLPPDVARIPRGAWLRSAEWTTPEHRLRIVDWAAGYRDARDWCGRFVVHETTTDKTIHRRQPRGLWHLPEQGPFRADSGTAVLVVQMLPHEGDAVEVATSFPDGELTLIDGLDWALDYVTIALDAVWAQR